MDDLLNNAPCGFLTFTDNGVIQEINITLLDMLGYELSDVSGRSLASLLTVGSRIFYQTHLFPLLKMRGEVTEIYLALRSHNGLEVPVLLNAVRRDRAATIVNECIFMAIRQRNRYEDEILLAKKTAEAATRDKELAYAQLEQVNEQLQEANLELEVQQEQLIELNTQLHIRVQREALLNQISQVFRRQREPENILEAAVSILGESLQADRCYFAEYDIPRDFARIRADWHRPELSSIKGGYHISDLDLDIAEVYGTDGLYVTQDIQSSEETLSQEAVVSLSALGIRAALGVALFDKGIPVAALNVAMANVARIWTEDDIHLVQAVATVTRTAMEEALLRNREHRIAEQLQDALQPKILPIIDGLELDAYYQPALDEASVGGDFYDVFPVKDGCYALVVADLSGKGLQAAAQVATVRHMLRASLYNPGATAAMALTSLNDMITEHELLSGFATLFIGAYDSNENTLTYVNAGQEPGLLRRAKTGVIEELGPTGPVLGGFPGARFTQRVTSLASGDVLALFTDGLTEAGLNRKDLLEMSGVIDIFRASTESPIATPRELTEHIMRGIRAKATPAGIRDDVCLLVAYVA